MKTKINKKIILISSLCLGILTIGFAIFLFLDFYSKIDYDFGDSTFEINSNATVEDLLSEVKKGTLMNGSDILNTQTLGYHEQIIIIRNNFGKDIEIHANFTIKDTIPPEITGEDTLTIYENDEIDILSKYNFTDNSLSDIETKIEGNYDTNNAKEYPLSIIATDQSKNTSTKSIVLNVLQNPQKIYVNKLPYYIKVNRKQNIVMVYTLDSTGNYNRLSKVFIASTGKEGSETPLGTFTVSDRYETLYLVGNVWGHYTLRINGAIFFHSVPYFTKGAPWDNLEYEEYNKLGEGASAGCVRLAAIDAKWVYDNIPYGTTVEIYDSDSLPDGVTKPQSIKIDINSDKRGWDPTDPDPNNPWN